MHRSWSESWTEYTNLMSKDFGDVWAFSWGKGHPFILPGDNPNYQLKLRSKNQIVHSQFMAELQSTLSLLN